MDESDDTPARHGDTHDIHQHHGATYMSHAGREQRSELYYNQPPSPAAEAFNVALTWAKDHPLICAAAVAAVIAIGPRRIMRGVTASSTALTAATLRNPQNIDTISRLITTAAGYMQRSRMRNPP